MNTHKTDSPTAPCNPSCKPRWIDGKGLLRGWQVKVCRTHQVIRDMRLMSLCKYLAAHPDKYCYVGSVWGQFDAAAQLSGKKWAAMISSMGYDAAPLILETGNGFYLQSGNIWYRNNYIDEIVLLRMN